MKSKCQFGFTLIESLVSVTIFALTVSSMVSVYVSIQRLNQTSNSIQALQQTARFISEDLTKIVRNGHVDWDSHQPQLAQPSVSHIHLIDQNNNDVAITLVGTDIQIQKAGAGTSNYNGREISVLNFRAYGWPDRDPFNGGPPEQPTITFYFELESNINERDKIRLPFQFTVATRDYN